MNPMVDGWMGDDWFHNGAFRQQNMSLHLRAGRRRATTRRSGGPAHFDDYDMFMEAGSAGELGRRRGLEQVGFWRKLLEHPAYDAFWQRPGGGQDPREAAAHGARDAGAQPVGPGGHLRRAPPSTRRSSRRTRRTTRCSWCSGPWHHGQEIDDGSIARRAQVRAATPRSSSASTILRPFLDHYLKDDAPKTDVAPVTAFETGTNTWRRLPLVAVGLRQRLHRQADAALSAAPARGWA